MFDPTLPADNSPLSSAEMRTQLTGLRDLIDTIPQGEPGPPGEPGPQGEPGMDGTLGTDGMDGTTGLKVSRANRGHKASLVRNGSRGREG